MATLIVDLCMVKGDNKMKLITASGIQNNIKKFNLELLQKLVGGFIEVVDMGSGNLLIVNEEGLLKKLPVNEIASKLAGYTIVGDALLTNKKEFK